MYRNEILKFWWLKWILFDFFALDSANCRICVAWLIRVLGIKGDSSFCKSKKKQKLYFRCFARNIF